MAYNHQQVTEAVRQALLEDPRTSLRVLSNRLGIERHTIRRALLNQLGVTFRDVQRRSLVERATALRAGDRPQSVKETAYALGYRSATSLSRLIKRARGHPS